jgi:hypothetical protein
LYSGAIEFQQSDIILIVETNVLFTNESETRLGLKADVKFDDSIVSLLYCIYANCARLNFVLSRIWVSVIENPTLSLAAKSPISNHNTPVIGDFIHFFLTVLVAPDFHRIITLKPKDHFQDCLGLPRSTILWPKHRELSCRDSVLALDASRSMPTSEGRQRASFVNYSSGGKWNQDPLLECPSLAYSVGRAMFDAMQECRCVLAA